MKSFIFFGDSALGHIVAERLQEAGYELAGDMGTADVILTYCLTQPQLEDAYWETAGILSKAHEGAYLVDLSPSTPSFAKELYALASVHELHAVDAPLTVCDITLHEAFSDRGNLVVLAGGEEEVLDEVLPLLRAIAGTVHLMGLPGNGQLAKVAQTIQFSSQLVALIESRAVCRANGESVTASVEASLADGFATPSVAKLCQVIEARHFHSTYTAQVLQAELAAVLNTSEDTDVVLPQSEACLRLVELFMVVGGTDMGATALDLVYADQEECDEYNLDWSRAEHLYGSNDDGGEDEDDNDYSGFDGYGDADYFNEYGRDDGEGYSGSYAGFSSN